MRGRKPEEDKKIRSHSPEKILLRKLLLFAKDVVTVHELGKPLHRFLFEDNNGVEGRYFKEEVEVLVAN